MALFAPYCSQPHGIEAHTVYRVESRGRVRIPLSSVRVEDKIEVFPEVETQGLFRLHFAGKELELVAGPYIGLIPINQRVTIDVRPRLAVSNLSRVIHRAQHPLAALGGVDRLYKSEVDANVNILEFLARNLVEAVRPILVNGMVHIYKHVLKASNEFRGKLDFQTTVSRNYSRGNRHCVYTHQYVRSIDNVYNQAIKVALWFAFVRLSRLPMRDAALFAELNTVLQHFDRVTMSKPELVVENMRRVNLQGELSSIRWYYERSIRIAVTILSHGNVGLLEHGSDVELSSFIVNFEELFEAYIRHTLRQHSAIGVNDVVVQDGNREGKKPLFDDVPNPLAQPDIVIRGKKRGGPVVLEVKYKDRISRTDINQAVVYGLSYRARAVVLIYQETKPSKMGLRSLGLMERIEVFAYGFDLSHVELQLMEEYFCECMVALAVDSKPWEPVSAARLDEDLGGHPERAVGPGAERQDLMEGQAGSGV